MMVLRDELRLTAKAAINLSHRPLKRKKEASRQRLTIPLEAHQELEKKKKVNCVPCKRIMLGHDFLSFSLILDLEPHFPSFFLSST